MTARIMTSQEATTYPLINSCDQHQLLQSLGSHLGKDAPIPNAPCYCSSLQANLEAIDCAQQQLTDALQLFSNRARLLTQLLEGNAISADGVKLQGGNGQFFPLMESLAGSRTKLKESNSVHQEEGVPVHGNARPYHLFHTSANMERAQKLKEMDLQLVKALNARIGEHNEREVEE